MFEGFKQRRPWTAVILDVLLSPFVAMLHLNRGKLALAYLLADIAIAVSVLSLLAFGKAPSLEGTLWLARTPLVLVGAVHSYRLASGWNSLEQKHWYSHWYGIVGILVLFPGLALAIRAFLFQPFDIPSSSMSPTLNPGDYFWVSKVPYDFSGPQRGDVIVLRLPSEGGGEFVKRVVGLPEDRVQMREGVLYINGVPARQQRVADFLERCSEPWPCSIRQFAEILPNGRRELILDRIPGLPGDDTPVFTVPHDSYFVLGDNRDNSMDSRNGMNFIPRRNIVGRVSRKFIENGHWTWQVVN